MKQHGNASLKYYSRQKKISDAIYRYRYARRFSEDYEQNLPEIRFTSHVCVDFIPETQPIINPPPGNAAELSLVHNLSVIVFV